MIVSASYKTDIPAFYGRWFMTRLRAGACRMVNPYSGKPYTIPLTREAVQGFVFWTRNAGPFLDSLDEVAARGFPFIVQYTVTGYPAALERSTIPEAEAVAHIEAIARHFGPRVAVWRYDPILFSDLTPPDWHRRTFERLARRLAGSVDEAVVSFAQIYRKSARNLDRQTRRTGLSWWDPDAERKRALLADLAAIGRSHGLAVSLCAQRDLLVDGVADAACIDARRLEDVAGRPLSVPRKAHRNACGCWASRDIGAYDTCPHGCAYCYAVQDRDGALANYRTHDPAGEFLRAPRGATETKDAAPVKQPRLL